MHWMLSGIGQSHRPISGTRGGGLRALHAERPGGVAGRAPARRRAAGRRQQPYFRRHQISHPIDLVARRALCRADRRAHRRRRRAAGAGRGRPRPGRGRRAAVEIPALPHPHLPPDRTDRGRLRAGLHLRRRADRLRLRREEHLRPAALSVPAAGAAALAAAHDGARLRPSDPHHLLGADRAGVRARALSDPAEGHPRWRARRRAATSSRSAIPRSTRRAISTFRPISRWSSRPSSTASTTAAWPGRTCRIPCDEAAAPKWICAVDRLPAH